MSKAIDKFASQFGAAISINSNLLVTKRGRYFFINPTLKPLISRDFYFAGTFLGKLKSEKFFPSFSLLTMLAKGETNKIYVDNKTAWLFICGRDVFSRGVLRFQGSDKKGSYVLVLNEYGECLGFGRINGRLDGKTVSKEIVVKNILDIGDFLRRER
jgi:ribosome biogenesis protein Nip4